MGPHWLVLGTEAAGALTAQAVSGLARAMSWAASSGPSPSCITLAATSATALATWAPRWAAGGAGGTGAGGGESVTQADQAAAVSSTWLASTSRPAQNCAAATMAAWRTPTMSGAG